MDIPVALPVAQIAHHGRDGISEVQGNAQISLCPRIGQCLEERRVRRIVLWSGRQKGCAVRQIDLRLGQPDELNGLCHSRRNDNAQRIGISNVFLRENYQTPRNELRIFACFKHSRQPVQSPVRIGIAQTLDIG